MENSFNLVLFELIFRYISLIYKILLILIQFYLNKIIIKYILVSSQPSDLKIDKTFKADIFQFCMKTSPSTRATHGFFLYVIIVVIAMGFWRFNNLYDDNLMF